MLLDSSICFLTQLSSLGGRVQVNSPAQWDGQPHTLTAYTYD